LVFWLAACFILAGALLDGGYQRSTPGSLQAQGTIVDFERGRSRQVYPAFEFKDSDGMQHRVVNSTQQGIAQFSSGDSVPIAYRRSDAPWLIESNHLRLTSATTSIPMPSRRLGVHTIRVGPVLCAVRSTIAQLQRR
jgi:hypothetical protein